MVFSTRLSKTLSTAIVCTHPVAPALHLGQEGFFCSHWLRHSPQNMWPQGTTECVATIKSCVGTAFLDIGSKMQNFATNHGNALRWKERQCMLLLPQGCLTMPVPPMQQVSNVVLMVLTLHIVHSNSCSRAFLALLSCGLPAAACTASGSGAADTATAIALARLWPACTDSKCSEDSVVALRAL